MCLHHPLPETAADCIVVLGSHDIRVAERGAQLFLKGLGKRRAWKPYSRRIQRARSRSLCKAGENMTFTAKLLKERKIPCETVILVQKRYMERRCLATFLKQWPSPQPKVLAVTSPEGTLEEYPNKDISLEQVINIMVGDCERMKLYAERGFQVPMEVPTKVQESFDALKQLGFVHHLVNK
eukprot:m.111286 g.111286  ORF g.111286 m.111286 type:complete len:181 (-) comp22771_c0_seq8:152-694(-)